MVWAVPLLIAASLAIYVPVWNHPFVDLDDAQYIYDNPRVVEGLTWSGVAWAFTTGHAANWHPLTWLSHMVDTQLFGLHPGPHHLTSVLLHVANTLLLFGLLHRTTGALGRSAVVAALFAVHPLHVESVAWAAERKDVLSTLFWMLTLWAYVAYARRPRLGPYLLVCLLFAMGLMAKPMLVTLPFVMLLLDYWPLGRLSVGKRLILEKLPLLVLVAASCVVTVMVQWEAIGGADRFPLTQRAVNALVSYVAYIGQMLWPTRLAVFYPYPRTLPVWEALASLLGLAGASVLVTLAGRRHPYLPVGWFWYLGTLVPVIGLVQVGAQPRADRYTYIPLIGLFIVVAWGMPELLARWRHRRAALAIAAGLAIVACTILASRQVEHWKSHLDLWARAVDVTTDNHVAHNNLGLILAGRGRLDEAGAHLRESLRIKPDYENAHNNLGLVLTRAGKTDDAITHFRAALRAKPDLANAHNNLGFALTRLGRTDEALAEYAEALRLKPDLVDAYTNRALVLARQGKRDAAIGDLREAVRLRPHDAELHYTLGVILADQGQLADAARSFETALKLDPRFQPARRALSDLRSRRVP